MTKKCDECSNCVLEYYGYSNYTVEGTYVHCSLKLHPEDGFDRFYGEDKRLEFAETCKEFTPGGAIEVDVDQEVELSPEEVIKVKAAGVQLWREENSS
jgi:hypothetical protein